LPLLDAIPALAAYVTPDRRYGWVNHHYDAFFGISRDQIIGRPIQEVLTPAAYERMKPYIDRVFEGEIVHYLNTLLRSGGSQRRLDTTYVPYFGGENAVIGMFVLAFDVTEHWETSERLRESELRFRQLVEHLQEVFWIRSGDGAEIYYVSPAFEKLWQAPTADLYRNPRIWLDSIHPDDRRIVEPVFPVENLAQPNYNVEYRIIRPDGSIRWIHDRGFPVRDATGRIVRVAGLAEDVTEAKLALDRERQLINDVVHMGRLTTMGELASGIAHELNQPLAAVINYIDASLRLLRRSAGAALQVREAMENAASEAERAGKILHRMTGFLRRTEPQRAAVNLNMLIHESLDLALRVLRLQDVQLIRELAEELPPVLADRIQIEQVVLNLVRNAVEAMQAVPPTERMLTVKTERASDSMLRAAVADNGCGLPPEAGDRLFQPFFTTKPAGMGMGLAICRTILTAHGGRLEALSGRERGAVFSFTLPIDTKGGAA
jgi:PAS domain S-box-containing protein